MKTISFFTITNMLLFVLCGCHSNKYIDNYIKNNDCMEDHVFSAYDPTLIEIEDTDEVYEWLEKHYCLVATSCFYGEWESRTNIIDCAKKYGIDVVLLIYKIGKTDFNKADFIASHGINNSILENRANYTQCAFFLAKRAKKNDFGVYLSLANGIPGKKEPIVTISVVIPNSIADKKGLKRGDKVVKINGDPVTTANEVKKYIIGKADIVSLEVSHE